MLASVTLVSALVFALVALFFASVLALALVLALVLLVLALAPLVLASVALSFFHKHSHGHRLPPARIIIELETFT